MTITVGGAASELNPKSIVGLNFPIPNASDPFGASDHVVIADEHDVFIDDCVFDQSSRKFVYTDNQDTDANRNCVLITAPATGGGTCYVRLTVNHTSFGLIRVDTTGPGAPGFRRVVIIARGNDVAPLVQVRGAHGQVVIDAETVDQFGRGARNSKNIKQVAVTGNPATQDDWPAEVSVRSKIFGGTSGVFFQCCKQLSFDVVATRFGYWEDANGGLFPYLNETTAAGNLPATYRNVTGGNIVKADYGNASAWNNYIAANPVVIGGSVQCSFTSPWADSDQPSTFLRTLKAFVAEGFGTQGVVLRGPKNGGVAEIDSDIELNRGTPPPAGHEVRDYKLNSARFIRSAANTTFAQVEFVDHTSALQAIDLGTTSTGNVMRRCVFGTNRTVNDPNTLGFTNDESTGLP